MFSLAAASTGFSFRVSAFLPHSDVRFVTSHPPLPPYPLTLSYFQLLPLLHQSSLPLLRFSAKMNPPRREITSPSFDLSPFSIACSGAAVVVVGRKVGVLAFRPSTYCQLLGVLERRVLDVRLHVCSLKRPHPLSGCFQIFQSREKERWIPIIRLECPDSEWMHWRGQEFLAGGRRLKRL